MALCPRCQAAAWGSVSTLVRPKHDPTSGSVWPTFRTVMSGEFMGGSVVFLQYAAQSGTVFKSLKHGGYCLFGPPPPGQVAGSAVPALSPVPTYPEPYLMVADLLGSPHVYAQGTARVQQYIDSGQFVRLPRCSVAGCNNEAVLGGYFCILHISPPLAH
jgi:hypothetical protein